MADLESWFQALEALPAKYPSVSVGEALSCVADLWLGKLTFQGLTQFLKDYPAPLVTELLDIVNGAVDENRGRGGGSAGRPVQPATGPPTLRGAAANPLPIDR